ncbi:MAG: CHAT domain-containing protein, partial [Chloroflexales bacterium]|nr:CHAT domain-containing protein [Chloroflexales bacterium]
LRLTAVTPAAGLSPEARAEERAARLAALAPLVQRGELVLDEIAAPVTRRALNDRFRASGPPDIIHFVGHGRYLDGRGYLVLDTAEGGFDPVPAAQVVQLLSQARLVVLHACQSAATSEAGLLTGVAPALSAAGVPAVVAMQLTVRVAAAIRFAEELYGALARGASLQQAVSLGRQVLYSEERDGASWYVPTLTIRARDPGPLYLFEE